jgi:2-polyprenyl-6-methoxyphenol hydroxylase-like FAD-dependent oxidoreductase
MYDVIVVGARCASSPLAMLLARKGYRVLLVDKATFPSDTLSSHYIQQSGVIHLQRWGLLDRLAATDTPPVRGITFDVGPFALRGAPAGHIAPDYCSRRRVIDSLLFEAAVEAGAEARMGFIVEELVWDGNRVAGIRGRTPGGATVTESASLVVGADGMHSLVARSVQAPTYEARLGVTCTYYSYWSDLLVDDLELYSRDRCIFGVAPTNEGLTVVVTIWPKEKFHIYRADIEGNFLRTLDLAPQLAERVQAGRREERFMGTTDLPFFFRQPYGAGWALVGDAGYHRDPVTAQGMSDAFRDAEWLAEAIDVGLGGGGPLDTALADYEQRRNEAVRPMYEFTYGLATLEPPAPEMQQLFDTLHGNQAATDRFFGVLGGTVSFPVNFKFESRNFLTIV